VLAGENNNLEDGPGEARKTGGGWRQMTFTRVIVGLGRVETSIFSLPCYFRQGEERFVEGEKKRGKGREVGECSRPNSLSSLKCMSLLSTKIILWGGGKRMGWVQAIVESH